MEVIINGIVYVPKEKKPSVSWESNVYCAWCGLTGQLRDMLPRKVENGTRLHVHVCLKCSYKLTE